MNSLKNIACVFPGQGSQSVGMAKDLFENFDTFKKTIQEASDTNGVDYKRLFLEGPSDKLNATENTQPAIVSCSVGAFRVMEEEFEFKPAIGAGHSVGEYSALACAGALKFSDAVKAVKLRGKAMQEAVPLGEGGMVALLGPSDDEAVNFCKWVESQSEEFCLEAANYNCPGQLVLSGTTKAIEWAKTNINDYDFGSEVKKVRLIPLKVSAPFHSKLMAPAETIMADFIENLEFTSPAFPIVQNVNAQAFNATEKIKKNLTAQICGSVLWTQSIKKINQTLSEPKTFVEVGAGTTLSGLIKKIDSSEINLFNTNQLSNVKEFESFYTK